MLDGEVLALARTPRTVAALNRLGLRAEDLQQASKDGLAKWAAEDKDGADLQEQRRLRLLQAVRSERDTIPAGNNCAIVVRSRSEVGTAATAAAARLAKFQYRARQNVLKMVEAESTKLDIVEKRRDKEAQLADRRRAFSATLADKRLQEEKKKDVIAKRRTEKLDKASAEKQESAQQAGIRATERLHRGIASRKALLQGKKEASLEKRCAIVAQQQKLLELKEQELQDEISQQCQKMTEQEEQLRQWKDQLDADREQCRQKREAAFEATRVRANETEQEVSRHIVVTFQQNSDKCRSAAERNEQKRAQKHANVVDQNRKRDTKSAKGSQREAERRLASAEELKQLVAAKDQRTHAFMEERRVNGIASMVKIQQRKSMWRELAAENRGHVHRAQQFRQGGVMKNLEQKVSRIDAVEQAQMEMQKERRDAVKEVWLQKEAFTVITDKLNTANSRAQFSKLCSQMGVDALSSRPQAQTEASNDQAEQPMAATTTNV